MYSSFISSALGSIESLLNINNLEGYGAVFLYMLGVSTLILLAMAHIELSNRNKDE